MERLPDNAALLVIDVQEGFTHPRWGARNNPDAERNIAALLDAWRDAKRPIIHVQHISQQPGSVFAPGAPGNVIKAIVAPRGDEPVIRKHQNSAFIGTDLERRLRDAGITHLVITGLTTDHCVSTTTRMAGNLGFVPFLVADATATFERTGPTGEHYTAQQIHDVNLASLHGEFADVVDTADVLAASRTPAVR